MKQPAIHIEDVFFQYPGQDKPFLQNFNLTVQQGERFGLFGPNGSGKTTLMLLMTGLLSSQKGEILLLGNNIQKNDASVKKLFGFVPQDFSFYQELSPAENLQYFGALSGLTKNEIKEKTNFLLGILGLMNERNTPVKKFSGGMKRRVNLAIGVIHNPMILFLDEPTVGVDVQTRTAIIDYLKELNKNGTTLIYTSHQLVEAEELCDHIALVDDGKIIAQDSLETLLSQYGHGALEDLFLNLTGKKYRD